MEKTSNNVVNNTLSYVFNLHKHGHELDFVDLDLVEDVNVYLDPILLYRSPIPEFNEAHTLIVEFFQRAINYARKGEHYKAELMCQFPDAENRLGIASVGVGHGPRKRLGYKIYEELVNNPEILEKGLLFLSEFQLLIDGIAFDLTSDAAVQISKDVFIKYTQKQCELFSIPTERIPIAHCYMWQHDEWDSKFATLPINPRDNKPFLLTPYSLVRKYPEGNYRQFYEEIYRHILLAREKKRLWQALAKEPKITFKEIEEKYKPTKEEIVKYVKKNPKQKESFFNKIRPVKETAWLEKLALAWGVNINQVILPETIDRLKEVFQSLQEKAFLKNVRSSAAHQQKLKKPRRRLVPQIEKLTKTCKEKVVLLLGNYSNDDGSRRLNEIKIMLSTRYKVVLLKDIQQVPGDSLEDTLNRIASLVRFTIVEDSYPGGQLFELASLKSSGCIMVILRKIGMQSSYMARGLSYSYTNIHEVDYDLIPDNGIKEEYVQEALKWAEERYRDKCTFWDSEYPWR